MNKRRPHPVGVGLAVAVLSTILLSACGDAADPADRATTAADGDAYVAERETVDGVSVVRTVAGSRWGADGELVEELAIGEEIGDEAYLFGQISAAWATEDRIYVVDAQVPAVRAFDHDGNHLFDIGSVGQGPGEFSRPLALAVADDGRVMVTDIQGARLSIFDPEGGLIEDWSLGSSQAAMGLEMTYDGELFTRMMQMPDRNSFAGGTFEVRMGMQAIGPDGLMGDPMFPPESDYQPPTTTVEVGGNTMEMALLPFTPSYQWILTPGGDIVAGVGDEYRFEVHGPDGSVRAIEKYWDPVAVDPDEIHFRTEMAAQRMRQMAPDLSIPASDVPEHKPAFTRFRADRSRRVWVARQGASRVDPYCTEMDGGGGVGGGAMMMTTRSGGGGGGGGGVEVRIGDGSMAGGGETEYEGDCWASTYVFDLFDLRSGEFLGSVPAPEPGFTIPLFVEGDTVLASVTDGLGVTRLKKYRLVGG